MRESQNSFALARERRELPETSGNFSDPIWVELKSEGEQIRKDDYTRRGLQAPRLERFSGRLVKMPMYEVASLFGEHMGRGTRNIPLKMEYSTKAPDAQDSLAQKNFNDSIWIKMNPTGEIMRRKFYERLRQEPPCLDKAAGGWVRMQIYEVFHFFGKNIGFGSRDLPIGMTFRTEKP